MVSISSMHMISSADPDHCLQQHISGSCIDEVEIELTKSENIAQLLS